MVHQQGLSQLQRHAARCQCFVGVRAALLGRAQDGDRFPGHGFSCGEMVVADDHVDSTFFGGVHGFMVSNANVGGNDQPHAIACGLFGRHHRKAVSFIESVRDVVAQQVACSQDSQGALQDQARSRTVDVVVGDDSNRLSVRHG